MYSDILGFKVFKGSKSDFIEKIKNNENKLHIVSGNPEVLYNGLNNELLGNNFRGDNSIIIPDGVGTLIASRMLKDRITEKIAGIEVMEELIKLSIEAGQSVYFLGASQESLEGCMAALKLKYPGLSIAGSHNGYFDMESCEELLRDIESSGADIIFVAMGAPRQEIFIAKYMDNLPCKIFMGVGGSFDVFAGKVNRAPRWMIRLGIEWLYRVAKEPFRIKRLSSIPKFLLLAAGSRGKRS